MLSEYHFGTAHIDLFYFSITNEIQDYLYNYGYSLSTAVIQEVSTNLEVHSSEFVIDLIIEGNTYIESVAYNDVIVATVSVLVGICKS